MSVDDQHAGSERPRLPSLEHVLEAAARIKPHVYVTPVLSSSLINKASGGLELFFKCENLQRCGSFKPRGALNAVLSLSDEAAAKGVVTHSSGNFAQAMAMAAQMRGITAYVVMPSNSPLVKQAAVVDTYGGKKVLCEPTLAAREATCAAVQAEHGATLLHPFNQFEVIAGQGSAALELFDQVKDLDAIVVPVGGGGLISGCSIVARAHGVRCIGAEPEMADDAYQSLHAKTLIPQTNPRTIADGLRSSLGDLTFEIIVSNVEEIVTVSEAEIAAAMKLASERLKVLIEPSSAVVLAAVLSPKFAALRDAQPLKPLRRIGLIVSGGNVDLGQISALVALASPSP